METQLKNNTALVNNSNELAKELIATSNSIFVKGARQNNLKNFDIEIPRNKLIVVTGVSGSGKSSFAFDTIYAEGQRRFVESLSAYVRQFLERMAKPDVDLITGLPPAIAIKQNTPQKNPRSTVGTTTEIYDYLRILFARIGITYDRITGEPIKKDSPDSLVKEIIKYKDGEKFYILFPFDDSNADVQNQIQQYKQAGFTRFFYSVTNEIYDLDDFQNIESIDWEKIYILVDRLVLAHTPDSLARLTDSMETAFNVGKGRCAIYFLSKNKLSKFSNLYEDPESGILYVEPEPKLFSFNSPQGACPTCQGFGKTVDFDEDLIFPDKSLSIAKDAIHPFKTAASMPFLKDYKRVLSLNKVPINTPISELSAEDMDKIMNGINEFPGINAFFKILEEKNYKVHYRVLLNKYRSYTVCKACSGSRLRTSARQVFIHGINIPEIINMPLGKLLDFFKNLKLTEYEKEVSSELMKEIIWRLQLLVDIGLDYLTLSRPTHTLSGGEAQRISLSTALGSSLVGTLYVLDEPSIGMHQRDTDRLVKILQKLRNLGNTILVVEHDPDIIEKADFVIDIGPNAGEFGGELIHFGDVKSLKQNKKSVTAEYIAGKKNITSDYRRKEGNGNILSIHKPRENNLKINKVDIPLGCIVCVTGVSGSGKSSLIHNVLYGGLKKLFGGFLGYSGKYDKITGYETLAGVEMVDQSSIGKSSRSIPISYIKAFDAIRELFSQTQLAKQLGYKPGFFSFNVPGGRCEVCEGEGSITIDMQFLPDVTLECEACGGSRYKREAINVHYNEKSIVDVLNMTVDDALIFFQDAHKIARKLKILQDVGLGYLKLGQSSTMLSGGESQRIKLAGHLDSKPEFETLFIFDEPTTGLHLDDISKLLHCFKRLIRSGNSVLVIEHNIHLIAAADYIIDLGPEAGEKGGDLVACGTPEQIMEVTNSYTGKALKDFFNKYGSFGF